MAAPHDIRRSLLFILIVLTCRTRVQFVEERTWIMGLNYKMGVDGIRSCFVMLTTFLMPIVIASCWSVNTRVKEYMIAFLLLETLMLGVFMAWIWSCSTCSLRQD
jgi:NADH-quinone oxidoreductase subunit M